MANIRITFGYDKNYVEYGTVYFDDLEPILFTDISKIYPALFSFLMEKKITKNNYLDLVRQLNYSSLFYPTMHTETRNEYFELIYNLAEIFDNNGFIKTDCVDVCEAVSDDFTYFELFFIPLSKKCCFNFKNKKEFRVYLDKLESIGRLDKKGRQSMDNILYESVAVNDPIYN